MKNLNNRGWGLSVLIGFLAFFLFILLLIVVLTYHVDRDNHVPLIEKEFIILNKFQK